MQISNNSSETRESLVGPKPAVPYTLICTSGVRGNPDLVKTRAKSTLLTHSGRRHDRNPAVRRASTVLLLVLSFWSEATTAPTSIQDLLACHEVIR